MNCRSARLLYEFNRPAENPDGVSLDDVQQHLASCPDCASWSQREQAADEAMGRAMCQVAVPESLLARIQSSLARDRRVVQWRRWTRHGSGLAAAAAIVVGVWLGLDWYQRQPAQLNLEKISNEVFMATANPSPESVEGWFAERGAEMLPPPNFNYSLLSYYNFTELQGKRTPLLVFAQPPQQARVFVLSDAQFDLREALAARQEQSSGCRTVVQPHPTDKRYAYLVVYNGESLDSFLAKSE